MEDNFELLYRAQLSTDFRSEALKRLVTTKAIASSSSPPLFRSFRYRFEPFFGRSRFSSRKTSRPDYTARKRVFRDCLARKRLAMAESFRLM
jgi:hypothetical protein